MNKIRIKFYRIIPFLLIIVSAICLHNFHLALDFYKSTPDQTLFEMRYFPSGRLLKIMACDYETTLADFVWLKAIQYYGQHILTDLNFYWLPHIFDILTVLDPFFINGYRFGGLLISEDLNQPERAIQLLLRGMYQNPQRYELPFDIGFINYTITYNYQRAAKYFYLAYLNEGIMGRSIRFAAQSYRKAGNRSAARDLWKKIELSATTPSRQKLARRSLNYIQIEEDMEVLSKAVDEYYKKYHSYPRQLSELVDKKVIPIIPEEPFGGLYFIQDSGQVLNSTLLYDLLEMNVRIINQRLIAYKAAKNTFPEDLNDLLKSRFIETIPPHPLDDIYIYDRAQGKVILPDYQQVVKSLKLRKFRS